MSRLDIAIVHRGLARSRALAQSYIESGNVKVNGEVINKASKSVSDSDEILITNTLRYVSRGGLKLEKALNEFRSTLTPSPSNSILNTVRVSFGEGSHSDAPLQGMGLCLDIGSSTGGFTDCLLQHGASHVTAIDVGSDQMDITLRNDKRITLYENTDIRNLKFNPHPQPLPQGEVGTDYKFDLITIDVSFISLTKVIPYLAAFCLNSTKVIALIKPQFEVGKGNSLSDKAYGEVIESIKQCFMQNGFAYVGHIDSPITGGDGNREFLMCVDYR